MWLCVVLALAIGWGGQFRYYRWLEENLSRDRPANATVEEMRVALDAERQRAQELLLEKENLEVAIRRVLSPEQQEAVKKAKPEWKTLPSNSFGDSY